MIKVNLVPAEILAKAHQRQQMIQVGVAGVLILIVVAGVSFVHWLKLNRMEAKLAKDQSDLKKLEVIVARVEELERTAAAVRSRLGVITDLLKSRPLYPYFMTDFARSVPAGVRVRSLSTSGGGSSAGALKLTMTAEARSNQDIADWVRNLEGSGPFSAVELGAISNGGPRVYNFSVTTTYTPKL